MKVNSISHHHISDSCDVRLLNVWELPAIPVSCPSGSGIRIPYFSFPDRSSPSFWTGPLSSFSLRFHHGLRSMVSCHLFHYFLLAFCGISPWLQLKTVPSCLLSTRLKRTGHFFSIPIGIGDAPSRLKSRKKDNLKTNYLPTPLHQILRIFFRLTSERPTSATRIFGMPISKKPISLERILRERTCVGQIFKGRICEVSVSRAPN